MLASHDGSDSLEASASAPAATPVEQETCFESPALDEEQGPAIAEAEGPFVRPLGAMLEDESELVLGDDDEPVQSQDSPLQTLAPLLMRETPLTWVFAGVRLAGDSSFGDGRLSGEWFAEEWRSESGRVTDLVIDATWPGGNVAVLKSHLKSRVVRHRPDVTFLFLDHSDATAGVEDLAHFERRLVAVLSILAEIGTQAILVQTSFDPATAGVDQEIYFEAVSGIARERNIVHLELPQPVATTVVSKLRTPDSPSRSTAIHLCRLAMQAISSDGSLAPRWSVADE